MKRGVRNHIIFVVVVVAWILFDRATKAYFESVGSGLTSPIAFSPLLEFDLVHNRGAAWGSFSGMVDGLIIVTSILCIAIAVYAFVAARRASLLEMIGLALVFAGGVGNLIDRLFYGYVVDFIAVTFIDFPTFNIADVGITCGIVCVLVSVALSFFAPSSKDGERSSAVTKTTSENKDE